MIIRTNATSMWGEHLIQLPPTEHQEIYLEFLDDAYRRAYSEEFRRAKDEFAAVFRDRGNEVKSNYLSLFRKTRISASTRSQVQSNSTRSTIGNCRGWIRVGTGFGPMACVAFGLKLRA